MTGGAGGGPKIQGIAFLEAVFSFRMSFLSLSIFLWYEFDVMAVSGAVCTFYKNNCLKTSVKSVTAAFIVNYVCKTK